MQEKKRNHQSRNLFRFATILPYVLVATALLVGSLDLFNRVIPDIHDLNVYLWAHSFHEAVATAHTFPHWLSTMWYGFGLPVFYYYNPLFYLVTEAFQWLGLGTVLSVKMTAFLAIPIGFFGLYFWARQYTSSMSSLIGGLIFVLSPYFLSLIYVRGALPEALALSFLPWLLYFGNRWIATSNYRYWLGIAVAATLLVLTHMLTAFIGAALLTAYLVLQIIWSRADWQTTIMGALAGITALALSAWYWLPAYMNLSSINPSILTGDKFFYGLNFPEFGEVFSPTFNASQGWLVLGLVPSAILLLGWVAFREVLHPSQRARLIMTLVFATVLVFLVLPFSDFLWNAAPPLELFQFPIRFLGPALLWLSLAGALLLEIFVVNPTARQWTGIGFMALIGALAIPFTPLNPHHLIPNMTEQDLNGYRYIERVASADPDNGGVAKIDRGLVAFEYLPRELNEKQSVELLQRTMNKFRDKEDPSILLRPQRLSGENLDISETEEYYNSYLARFTATEDTTLTINHFEFPAWKYFLDNQQVVPAPLKDTAGQSLAITAGDHVFEMKLTELPYQKTGRMISLLTLSFLLTATAISFVWQKYSSLRK